MRFQGIVDGFIASPAELIFALLFVGSIFLVLFFAGLLRLRKSRREIEARSNATWNRLLAQKNLTDDEQETVAFLASYLRSNERKYMLLMNPLLFDHCVEEAVSSGIVSSPKAASLRIKLGFSSGHTGSRVHSSAQVRPGSGVVLVKKGQASVKGRVLEQQPESFRVEVDTKKVAFAHSEPLEVYFHDGSGLYTYSSFVQGFSDGIVYLQHAEDLRRIQRREFFRRKMTLPVYARPAGQGDKVYSSHFLDLGAGGASLENPQGAFSVGEDISLSFHDASHQDFHLIGRIVRTSKRGSVLHVDFCHLQKNIQDKLYALLFQGTGRGT